MEVYKSVKANKCAAGIDGVKMLPVTLQFVHNEFAFFALNKIKGLSTDVDGLLN